MEIDKKMFLKIKQFTLDYKVSLLLGILFATIIFFQQLTALLTILSLISSLTLFFFILLFSKIKYRWLRILFGSAFALIVVIDFACAKIYNTRVNENIIGAILETNLGETIGMLGNWETFIPLLLIIIATFTLTLGSIEELRKKEFPVFKSFLIYVGTMLTISLACVLDHYIVKDDKTQQLHFDLITLQAGMKYNVTHTTVITFAPRMSIFYSDILGIYYYFRVQSSYKKYLASSRRLIDGMNYTSENQQKAEKIYLVIGESASSKHMSLYGYNIPTTPFLDKLKADSTLFYHTPAISSQLVTRSAVTYMLTAENLTTGEGNFYNYKNLIELANEANYETLWISNQSTLGIYEGYIPLIASYATHREHNIKAQEGYKLHYEDKELLPILDKYYQENKKQLFIIHLEGSHRDFQYRYDEIDEQAIAGNGAVVNYDRTIHHTDRVLKKIYDRMPPNSVMLYASDHGEYPNTPEGRYELTQGSYAYHVPFVLIDKTDKNLKQIAKSYYAPQFGFTNNSSTYYILSEFLGYTVEQNLKEQLREQSDIIHIPSSWKAVSINEAVSILSEKNKINH